MNVENPKHKQGDGAGFGRLRAEQVRRSLFHDLIKRSHPSAEIYIDKVYEYAGSQIAFYRLSQMHFEQARCATFIQTNGNWSKDNDIIIAINDL